MSRIAYFDCLSGISGDMTLGALIDLGVDPGLIQSAVRSMGLPDLSIEANTVKKCGFRAIKVNIDHPPEHAHRHLHHITEMIDRADQVAAPAKDLAKAIFQEVAVAEAKVHGTTLQKVHFHEVGAIDSIADIVGCAVGLHDLGIQTIAASAVPTGTGSIKIAHGRVSVPAPATAEILRGIPIAASDIQAELTTPTGAAILKANATAFGPMPAMTIEAVGYGAGTMDIDGQANVLRVLLGQTSAATDGLANVQSDDVVVLSTNIDDCSAERLADCAERLMKEGALDVFQVPCTMKKGRAGVMLTVIASPMQVPSLEQIIFQHTSTIGIRRHSTQRHKLARASVRVETQFGEVNGKIVELPDGTKRFSVEDDSAKQLAAKHDTTALAVTEAARAAWRKQAGKAKSKPKKEDVLEVRFPPGTNQQQQNIRIKKLRKMLRRGRTVRIVCMSKDQDENRLLKTQQRMEAILETIQPDGTAVTGPRQKGRRIVCVVANGNHAE